MRTTNLLLLLVLLGFATGVTAQEPTREWRYFGGDAAFTRYAPLDQIDRHNVDQLEIVWRRPAADPELLRAFPDLQPNAYLKSTPVIIEDGRRIRAGAKELSHRGGRSVGIVGR